MRDTVGETVSAIQKAGVPSGTQVAGVCAWEAVWALWIRLWVHSWFLPLAALDTLLAFSVPQFPCLQSRDKNLDLIGL